jgi:hypothetical protein
MPSQKESVLARLREQISTEAVAKRDELLRDWLSSLQSLFAKLRSWLEDGVKEGLFRLEEYTVSLDERRLGKYEAPAFRIVTPRGDMVNVHPRARMVAGALGRVDFERVPKTVMLVRTDREHWQFLSGRPSFEEWVPGATGSPSKDLSEESFWETLEKLIP